MYDIILKDFVNNPWFVLSVACMCECFETEFNEEFNFELIDKSEILYDFIETVLID